MYSLHYVHSHTNLAGIAKWENALLIITCDFFERLEKSGDRRLLQEKSFLVIGGAFAGPENSPI